MNSLYEKGRMALKVLWKVLNGKLAMATGTAPATATTFCCLHFKFHHHIGHGNNNSNLRIAHQSAESCRTSHCVMNSISTWNVGAFNIHDMDEIRKSMQAYDLNSVVRWILLAHLLLGIHHRCVNWINFFSREYWISVRCFFLLVIQWTRNIEHWTFHSMFFIVINNDVSGFIYSTKLLSENSPYFQFINNNWTNDGSTF